MRHTSGISGPSITPPSRSERDPTEALTAVPAAIASSIRLTPPTLPSGSPRGTSRRKSTVATMTSSTLPAVCPSAEPSGSAP